LNFGSQIPWGEIKNTCLWTLPAAEDACSIYEKQIRNAEMNGTRNSSCRKRSKNEKFVALPSQ
jgi:hypothetical protein